MVDEHVRVCCDMVVAKGEKILMGRRGNVFGKGSWALPGGHLELNETTEECVLRELSEEIGIIPTKMKLVGVVNDIPDIPGQTNHYVRFVYLITNFKGEIKNKEPDKCDGWEWFDSSKLPKPTFVGHIKVLKLFFNKKKKFFQE